MQPVSATPQADFRAAGRADSDLARAARDLETSFLSVMLREAGVGAPRAAFGGGLGEDQFASFLADAYAKKFVERGGIGFAEVILRSLKERADG